MSRGTGRRTALTIFGGVAVVLVLPAGGIVGWVYVDSGRSNAGTLSFRNPLKIPPVLEPSLENGRKQFQLDLQRGESEFLPGTTTQTWGANGPYLGPTIRVNVGDEVGVDVANSLGEMTTLHWHGMHLPGAMDGGPHQEIPAGETWQPYWRIVQPAATLWYHPHLHRTTAEHVYRGIAGLFLIDDPAHESLPLPQEYGVDDVPLVVQDKKINDDGSLDTSEMAFGGINVTGLLGDKILINGTYDPFFEVTAEATRFRLLNGSNARFYHIGFADDREFTLVATDSGLLPTPERVDRLFLSPGERAEIVARFTPGEEVVLRSTPPPLGTNFAYERLSGGDDTHDLLKLVAADQLRPSPAIPETLVPEWPVAEASGETIRMEMGDFTLNDKTMDMSRLDRIIRAGTGTLWEVVNPQSIPHNFHIHGCSFHVLDVNGEPPPVRARGLKDTVYMEPGTTVRLAAGFPDYSDPEHPFMFHCHILAHEDAGMMGQFVLVDEADEARIEEIWGPELDSGPESALEGK